MTARLARSSRGADELQTVENELLRTTDIPADDVIVIEEEQEEEQEEEEEEEDSDECARGGYSVVALLSVLGLCNGAEAVEVLSTGYVLNGVDVKWRPAISAGVYIGMLVGGLVNGVLADRYWQNNRVAALRMAMGLATVGAVCGSAAWSPFVFLVCRVVAGCGVGAATPPLFALAAEISPRATRGACVSFVAAWWMVGSIFAAASAKLLLPLPLTVDWSLTLSRWRLYSALCASTAFCACLALFAWPTQNSKKHALKKQQELLCFCRRGRRRQLWALCVIFVGLNYGYYGLATWITVLLARVGVRDVYGVALLYASANLPGNVVALLLIDRVGRRPLLSAAMAIAGLSAASLGVFVAGKGVLVIITCALVFNGAMTTAWAALNTVSVESFAAKDRATALGFLTALGRCSSIAAQFANGFFSAHDNAAALFGITASLIFAAFLATTFVLADHPSSSNSRLTTTTTPLHGTSDPLLPDTMEPGTSGSSPDHRILES